MSSAKKKQTPSVHRVSAQSATAQGRARKSSSTSGEAAGDVQKKLQSLAKRELALKDKELALTQEHNKWLQQRVSELSKQSNVLVTDDNHDRTRTGASSKCDQDAEFTTLDKILEAINSLPPRCRTVVYVTAIGGTFAMCGGLMYCLFYTERGEKVISWLSNHSELAVGFTPAGLTFGAVVKSINKKRSKDNSSAVHEDNSTDLRKDSHTDNVSKDKDNEKKSSTNNDQIKDKKHSKAVLAPQRRESLTDQPDKAKDTTHQFVQLDQLIRNETMKGASASVVVLNNDIIPLSFDSKSQ